MGTHGVSPEGHSWTEGPVPRRRTGTESVSLGKSLELSRSRFLRQAGLVTPTILTYWHHGARAVSYVPFLSVTPGSSTSGEPGGIGGLMLDSASRPSIWAGSTPPCLLSGYF